MISASFPAEEPAERASSSHFPLPAQDPQVPKQPAGGAAEEEPQSSPAPSPEPPVRAEEQDGSESPAPESERDVQTETSEASAQPQAPMVYVPGAMSQAQISAYNSSLQGFLAARLSAVRALVNRDRPDPEEENKAWEVGEMMRESVGWRRVRCFGCVYGLCGGVGIVGARRWVRLDF